MDPTARLLELILGHPTATIDRGALLDYCDRCFPEWRNDPDREVRYGGVIGQLGHTIALPSARTAKTRAKNYLGALPRFVRKKPDASASADTRPSSNWLPQLAELAANLRGDNLEALGRINEFLKANPGPLPPIPYRERSLQIFGDEKKIGKGLPVKRGSLFDGRLPLAWLGACDPPLPFPFTIPDRPCPGAPLLVVENHHTFVSLVAANDRQRAFAAIAWGNGNAFTKGCAEYIDIILNRSEASGAMYLGDLDPKGILIPASVDRARQENGLRPIAPARQIYAWLLIHGTRRPLGKDISSKAREAALEWLGDDIGAQVLGLWEQGYWLPQEAFSADVLMVNALPSAT